MGQFWSIVNSVEENFGLDGLSTGSLGGEWIEVVDSAGGGNSADPNDAWPGVKDDNSKGNQGKSDDAPGQGNKGIGKLDDMTPPGLDSEPPADPPGLG